MSRLNLLTKIVTTGLIFILLSCSKDTPHDPMRHGFVEVRSSGIGGIYFITTNGTILRPTAESTMALELSPGIAYIIYQELPVEEQTSSSNQYIVEVLAGVSLDREFVFTDAEHVDNFAPVAPIIGLGRDADSPSELFIMSDRYLILGVNYYFGAAPDLGAMPHDFTIVYNADETTDGSANLKLYLRHDNNDDTKHDYQSYQVVNSPNIYIDVSLYYMAFDINEAIDDFITKTGKSEFEISLTVDVATEYYQTIEDATQIEYFRTIELSNQ